MNIGQTNTHYLMYVWLYQTTFGIGKLLHEFFPDSFACIFQVPRGTNQEMSMSCLHPCATMGQQAGKQRVAWQTYFSAICGEGLRLLTG